MKASKILQQVYNNYCKNAKIYKPMMHNDDLKVFTKWIVLNHPELVPTLTQTAENITTIINMMELFMNNKKN